MSPRLIKYLRLLQHPACWPALRQGVAATLEHDTALGREQLAALSFASSGWIADAE